MLTRSRNPFDALYDLRSEFDRIFQEFAPEARSLLPGRAFVPRAFPLMNLQEHDDALVIEAELPSFTLEEIELSLLGRELTIQGRHEVRPEREGDAQRTERPSMSFSRTITLPYVVNPDRVEARLTEGILRVTMPKAESARARRIQVRGE